MKNLVEDGVVGTPTMVWCTRLGWLDPKKAPAWRLDDSLSGGTIIELGVHEIDFLRWIGGDWESVYARGSSDILIPGKFQDTVSAVGTLASGAIARLDISWANPRYLWQRGVEGTEGSIFFDDSNVREVVLNRPNKKPKIYKVGDWQNPATKENLSLRDQTIAVLKALAAGDDPPVAMEDGIAAVQAALAMRESARTGRVVQINQKSK
jgi:predicted dehydrogenase